MLRTIWYMCIYVQHLLISLARGVKYFYNVELLHSLDKFQTNLIFYRGNIKQKHHFYRVAETIKVMSNAFAVILSQQRPVLVSTHAQNFFSWSSAKKMLQGNANCSAPKTVIGVTKVANERYLPYLQLCGKTFLWIFMYCRCKSGPKLG